MNVSANSIRSLHWLNFSGAVLIALLQRTPVLRTIANASDFVLHSPTASLLKSAISALGALGAQTGDGLAVEDDEEADAAEPHI